MTDILTIEQRSERMRRIRGRGNETTELALIRVIRLSGIKGWRRHLVIRWDNHALNPKLQSVQALRNFRAFVAPDFVFVRDRVALFVDGCFWHSCPLHGTMPKSRTTFWSEKLSRNRARDSFVEHALLKTGWSVIRIWEHEIQDAAGLAAWLIRNFERVRARH